MQRMGVAVAIGAAALVAGAGPAGAAAKHEAKKAKPPAPAPAPAPDPDVGDGPGSGSDAPAALPPHLEGPRLVDLGNGVEIDLPAGMILFERAAAEKLEREDGNDPTGVVAMVVGKGGDWWMSVDYIERGHVTDSDGDQLDAGSLLETIRTGTTEQNATRRAQGIPELLIDGWTDEPRYVRASHQLAWGIRGHDTKGQQVINSFIHVLGRTGDVITTVVAPPEAIAAARTEARAAIDGVRFRAGSRYEDYDESTDHSSGLGLTGLVIGGVVVAKGVQTGFFIGLLLALKKLIIVIAAAIAAFFRWLFRRKPKAPAAPTAPIPPLPPDATV